MSTKAELLASTKPRAPIKPHMQQREPEPNAAADFDAGCAKNQRRHGRGPARSPSGRASREKRAAGEPPEPDVDPVQTRQPEPDAYTVEEFCTAHRISRSTLYNLFGDGVGPAIMRVGKKVLISREAAAKWRRARETDAKKAAQRARAA